MILRFDTMQRQRRSASPALALTGISTLSRQTGASCRALRYYEEVGLLRPTRTSTRGRLFSPHQCDVAWAIVVMRRLDVPIAEIRSILDGARSERERVSDLRKALEAKAATLADQLCDVRQALTDWCDPRDLTDLHDQPFDETRSDLLIAQQLEVAT